VCFVPFGPLTFDINREIIYLVERIAALSPRGGLMLFSALLSHSFILHHRKLPSAHSQPLRRGAKL
jgi:hypothetical protein